MSHLIFAYGSNLNATDLGRYTAERGLAAMYPKKVCNACLHDWCACWTAYSKRRNSGVLNIEPAKGQTVWGTVFDLTDDELVIFDRKEGHPKHYLRKPVTVTAADGRSLEVETYVAPSRTDFFFPNQGYLTVVVEGMKEQGLPEDYICDFLKRLQGRTLSMNTALLRDLYAIHSPTGNEWEMICFVRQWLAEQVPEALLRMDAWGNLYITKGEAGTGYPTLACHLDQVQTLHSEDFEVREEEGKLYGWSEKNQQREGLGADDKNGIYVCLRCLKECPHLKVFMAVGEEKGCIGSCRADMAFFADSLYVLESDRGGGEEPSVVLRGIPCASDDFVAALQLDANGYTLAGGKTSDILALTFNGIGVSCINLPAGYHNPHKDDEYTVMEELERCLTFVRHTVENLRERYPHRYWTETQRKIMEQF